MNTRSKQLGFGMERMPCGQFASNAIFFRIGAIAYNLFVIFKTYVLPEEWKKYQMQTMRWRLYQSAACSPLEFERIIIQVVEKNVIAMGSKPFASIQQQIVTLLHCCTSVALMAWGHH
ncbi:MAG: transposase [Mariprofundaceae bacterium]